MNKHPHDREGREQIQRRLHREASYARRATDGDQDKPRRSRHAPYHRERHRYFDEWDAD